MACVVVSFDNFRPSAAAPRPAPATLVQTAQGYDLIRIGEDTDVQSAMQLAGKSGCTIVHLHQSGLFDFAAQLGARLVFSLHVLQSEQDRLRGTPASRSTEAQARAMQAADALHLPSQAVADLLRISHPELMSKAQVIPLASAAAETTQGAFPETDTRAALVAYVGRFADINGFAQFLQALPELFAQNPALRAVAAGGLPGNPRGESRWRKRWQAMAGIHAQKLDMPGWLSQPQLAALYQRAALLVVPSWFETFGQVVLEGILHGTPLVTTGAGAIAELVDENSALLIEARSSDAIAAGVQDVLDNPRAAQKRARTAYHRAQQAYRWRDRIPAFVELYRSAHAETTIGE
jgi:glycogen(starch) synthase